MSCPQHLSTRVPQGSVLGPLFFTVYTNDLPQTLQFADISMYADDTALIITGDNMKELEEEAQIELAIVSEWFVANKLTINTTKTKYTAFHSRSKIICNGSVPLHINQCPLELTY